MRRRVYNPSPWLLLRDILLGMSFSIMVYVMVSFGVDEAVRASSQEAERILRDSLQRAAVTSYAIEGRYPASLCHLENTFGISIDHERFVVHYSVLASNLPPIILVIAVPR